MASEVNNLHDSRHRHIAVDASLEGKILGYTTPKAAGDDVGEASVNSGCRHTSKLRQQMFSVKVHYRLLHDSGHLRDALCGRVC